MRLSQELPSDNVEVHFSYMMSSINHANVTAAMLTFFAAIVVAMLVVVVIELKEIDDV